MIDCAEVAATLHAHLCEHDCHGYTQGAGRWGNGEGYCYVESEGRTYAVAQGDRDCSSSVIDCWQRAIEGSPYEGALDTATYTGDMRSLFIGSGLFTWEPMSYIAQRGDIYLNERDHTAMCQSAEPDILSEFLSNEFGGITGGQVGDQTGGESIIRGYWDFPWNGILRYNGAADWEPGQSADAPAQGTHYRVSCDPEGVEWLAEMRGSHDTGGSGDDFAGITGKPIRWIAIDCPSGYQVETEGAGWLPMVYGYDTGNLDTGCAGDGTPIVALRANGIRYAVAPIGGGFLPVMDGQTDTGGSADTFAGNGSQIDRLRVV